MTSVSSISLKVFVKELPYSSDIILVLIVMVKCGNKWLTQMLVRLGTLEGYALRKSLKGLKYKKQKEQSIECVASL